MSMREFSFLDEYDDERLKKKKGHSFARLCAFVSTKFDDMGCDISKPAALQWITHHLFHSLYLLSKRIDEIDENSAKKFFAPPEEQEELEKFLKGFAYRPTKKKSKSAPKESKKAPKCAKKLSKGKKVVSKGSKTFASVLFS